MCFAGTNLLQHTHTHTHTPIHVCIINVSTRGSGTSVAVKLHTRTYTCTYHVRKGLCIHSLCSTLKLPLYCADGPGGHGGTAEVHSRQAEEEKCGKEGEGGCVEMSRATRGSLPQTEPNDLIHVIFNVM